MMPPAKKNATAVNATAGNNATEGAAPAEPAPAAFA
jgi:hypothetical protein